MQDSRTTDRLQLLMQGVKDLPKEVLARVTEVDLIWKTAADNSMVPEVNVKLSSGGCCCDEDFD